MTDKFSPERRSEIMRAVRSKGNASTELKLIELFKERGIVGWRRGYKVKGKPDFVFLKQRVAIFVDGCFWHGHAHKHIPRENSEFWEKKIARNMERDREVTAAFVARGWTVLRVWECEFRKKNAEILFRKIDDALSAKTR